MNVVTVRIKKCDVVSYWYAGLEGTQFECYDDGRDFILKEDYDGGGERWWRHISKEDCEILTIEVEQLKGAIAMNQQPMLGQPVYYILTEGDAKSISRQRFHNSGKKGNPVEAGERVLMTIVRVWPDYFGPGEHGVNGQCALDGDDAHWVTSKKYGHEPGNWHSIEDDEGSDPYPPALSPSGSTPDGDREPNEASLDSAPVPGNEEKNGSNQTA